MTLPFEDCEYKINTVDASGAAPHTHIVTSEIIQTFEDEGNILINGKLYRMQKNGLYFIYGLATHFVIPENINRYNHTILSLNTPEIEKLCHCLSMSDEYRMIFIENGGSFCELSDEDVIKTDMIFLKIRNLMHGNDSMKYARLAALFTELMEIGIKNITDETEPGTKISDILSFISDNALKKFSIDDICKKTHISKSHLCRLFKENIGVTIGSFIKNRRLSAAKQMLADTDRSIIQIAYKCGFSDSSFFSKTFSKEFGISPTAFRKKYR